MKIRSIIIRPTSEFELEGQFESLKLAAHVAMQEVADVNLGSVSGEKVSNDAYVNLGTPTEPNVLCLWQLNLVGAVFVADGVPYAADQPPVVHIDEDTRSYSVAAVVNPNGSW